MVAGEGGLQLTSEPSTNRSVPDQWLVIEMRCSAEAEDAAVEALLAMGGRAVEERDGMIVTHLDSRKEPQTVVASIRERLIVAGFPQVAIGWRWQAHEDWEELWKQGLGLRRVTPRMGVLPSWCDPDEPVPEMMLVIDPGMAFGTAEHATTRGCLRLLDRVVCSGQRLLDAGSGSAILSIAAVKLGARSVLAVELDAYACEAARENVARNDTPEVAILNDTVSEDWLAAQPSFDGIIANMQAAILGPLMGAFRRSLELDGWLIVSGVLDTEWSKFQAAATMGGFSLEAVDSEKEWCSGWFSVCE